MKENIENLHKYDDIIQQSHPISETHPHMAMIDRAAQFSPFSALTGYEAAIKETERLTEQKLELDDGEKERINERLVILNREIQNHPLVEVTYFQKDEKKDGGEYITRKLCVKKLDLYQSILIGTEEEQIYFEDIIKIDGEIF